MHAWLVFLLLASSFTAAVNAAEVRALTFSRFGTPVTWSEDWLSFPGLPPRSTLTSGRLSMAFAGQIASVQPYAPSSTGPIFRPVVLDDLVYESLMLPDPVKGGEDLYPLIAREIRYEEDLSHITFHLDPRARFQSGSVVTAEDVLFSIEHLTASRPATGLILQEALQSIEPLQGAVRFNFKVRGQKARDAIMILATAKIVRPQPRPATLSGIPVEFIATGAYRIAQLGPSQLVLVKDTRYWAWALPTRQGLFNFTRIEMRAMLDANAAHEALTGESVNYFAEDRSSGLERTFLQLSRRNPRLRLVREFNSVPGRGLDAFAFNPARPAVSDPRVRHALLLAFDFERINRQLFGAELRRPSTVLDRHQRLPTGVPQPEVQAILQQCNSAELPAEVFGDALYYGNDSYRRLADNRTRLLQASRLLQTAGFRLLNGRWVSATGVPLKISLLLRDLWEIPVAKIYKEDLKPLGIELEILTAAAPSEFHRLADLGNFDLISADADLLTTDGRPSAYVFSARTRLNSICMDQLAEGLQNSTFDSPEYYMHAEALARADQALFSTIFIGESRRNDFILDERIQLPDGLSHSRAHLYGFWQDAAR